MPQNQLLRTSPKRRRKVPTIKLFFRKQGINSRIRSGINGLLYVVHKCWHSQRSRASKNERALFIKLIAFIRTSSLVKSISVKTCNESRRRISFEMKKIESEKGFTVYEKQRRKVKNLFRSNFAFRQVLYQLTFVTEQCIRWFLSFALRIFTA